MVGENGHIVVQILILIPRRLLRFHDGLVHLLGLLGNLLLARKVTLLTMHVVLNVARSSAHRAVSWCLGFAKHMVIS